MLHRRHIYFIFIARIFLFLPFMTVACSIPVLIEEWQIGAARVGTIVSGFFVAYAVSLMGFSWLGDVIGAKRAVQISAVATAITCAVFGFFAVDFLSSLILYSLVALSQGGVYTPLIALFRENTPPQRLGSAIGWLISSTSVGYAASMGLTGLGIGLEGWRLGFLITGTLPIIGTLILLLIIRGLPNLIHLKTEQSGLFRQLRSNRPARLLLYGYSSHNWELIGLWSWAPALIAASYVLSGKTTVEATLRSAQFITIVHICGAFAAFSLGTLSDRIGRRTVLIWSAAVAAAFSFSVGWLVAGPPFLIASLVIVHSFFALGDSPVLSTAMAEEVEPASLGALFAARSLIGFIVAAIAPIAVGSVIDALRAINASDTVVWGVAFTILGLGGVLAVLFARALPRRG